MGSVRIRTSRRMASVAQPTMRTARSMSLVDVNAPGRTGPYVEGLVPSGFFGGRKTLSFVEGAASADSGAYHPRKQTGPRRYCSVRAAPRGAVTRRQVGCGRRSVSPAFHRSCRPASAKRARSNQGASVRQQHVGRWLPDGRHVFVGNEAGRPRRVFIQNIAGGPPEPLTPEGVNGPFAVSPDSTMIVGLRHRRPNCCEGTRSRAARHSELAGALPGDAAMAWTPDGECSLGVNRANRLHKIFRIELRTGRRTHWRDVPYPDPAAQSRDLFASSCRPTAAGSSTVTRSTCLSSTSRKVCDDCAPVSLDARLVNRAARVPRARRGAAQISRDRAAAFVDEHAKAVADATVTLTNPRTGFTRTTDSDGEGLYRIPGCPLVSMTSRHPCLASRRSSTGGHRGCRRCRACRFCTSSSRDRNKR